MKSSNDKNEMRKEYDFSKGTRGKYFRKYRDGHTVESIRKGLTEAVQYSEGKSIQAKVYKPKMVNVKEIRSDIGMTQTKFAATFGISLGTLRHWERGDRRPNGPALILLNLVKKEPETILNILTR